MAEFYTTKELAELLRVKERKVYELASDGKLPVRRVTGKLLFPKDEIESWIAAKEEGSKPAASGEAAAGGASPAIIVGGHDPLLEWALRESRSGIAAFLDGALDGLKRGPGRDYIAAGLHIPENSLESWNIATVNEAFAKQPVVLIEWAKRTRGLIFRTDLGRSLSSLTSTRGLRFQRRQADSGSELVLKHLLDKAKMTAGDLHSLETIERTELDLALAIADGRAEVGLGIESMARQFRQGFAPLVVERYDLLVWRKAYFDPPFQNLMRFCASDSFKRRARDFGGYDISGFGTVHFNGG